MQSCVIAFMAALLFAATSQARSLINDQPKYHDLPINRQDTALKGDNAAIARRKAEMVVVAGHPTCEKPLLRYSTVPLTGAVTEGHFDMVESEVWYFECPDVIPVLVRYRTTKEGLLSEIHARDFRTMAMDLPTRKLANTPNPEVDFETYRKRTGLHEASCFGILSDALDDKIVRKVPRLATPGENRGMRAMCLRMQACNSIDPEVDIMQDITARDAKPERRKYAQEFTQWCNGQDTVTLMAEEPELTYGLTRLLPMVGPLTDMDEKRFKEEHRRK